MSPSHFHGRAPVNSTSTVDYRYEEPFRSHCSRPAGLVHTSSTIMVQYTPSVTAYGPDMDIESLCNPVMAGVIIATRQQAKRFRIPLALICSVSAYFNTVLTQPGKFTESRERKVIMKEDVPVWSFITFVYWLYSKRLTLTATKEASLDDLLRDGRLEDPSTWPYATLFLLYAMADRLDTLTLRRLIIEQVQIKMKGNTPQAPLPSFQDMMLLQQTTPTSSPLRRWVFFRIRSLPKYSDIANDYVSRYLHFIPSCPVYPVLQDEATRESYEELLGDLDYAHQSRAKQVVCFNCGMDANLSDRTRPCDRHHYLESSALRNTDKAFCLFHEHGNDAEMEVCEHRLETIPKRFQGYSVPAWIAADED